MNTHSLERLATRYGNIAYYRQDQNLDQTLIFLHGNSTSSQFWHDYFNSNLREHFNLLALDLPGHGNSPRATDPAAVYNFEGYRDMLLEVIDVLVKQPYYLIGHSLGGHIILEALPHLKNCQGVFIMGTPPFTKPLRFEEAFYMNPQLMALLADDPNAQMLQEILKTAFAGDDEHLIRTVVNDYLQTDPRARKNLMLSLQNGQYSDEVEHIKCSHIPVHMAYAEGDVLIKGDYFRNYLPEYSLIKIPEAGHYAPLEQPETFIQLIVTLFSAGLVNASTPKRDDHQ